MMMVMHREIPLLFFINSSGNNTKLLKEGMVLSYFDNYIIFMFLLVLNDANENVLITPIHRPIINLSYLYE